MRYWWRWWESDPRPKWQKQIFLREQLILKIHFKLKTNKMFKTSISVILIKFMHL